ncbi:transcription factor MYB36-like [Zingiber officinale]|uniref:Uncharacterized protein n=1 Tax=Zingiber officinale TaxID=94328 RepID=A0A8J5EUL2_ZINOF|nr:transcription factor MYB36-like [Zingiber officinale]XP_042442035.1 transcription factor MYB36-like [Zingiber officinale]KAG6473298.1 hypothetical protein ZIOFF_067212 [Zingiber officinale]
MGRAPCCDKANVKKGPWSAEEDAKLRAYIETNGTGGNWIALPHKIGLKRCGKSCRLRWLNYLRPNIKHGGFSEEEDQIILSLYISIGSRWSIMAAQLPGRTDNDIKNYWNTKLKKKLLGDYRKINNRSKISPQYSPINQEHSNLQGALINSETLISASTVERIRLQMCYMNKGNNDSAFWPICHVQESQLTNLITSPKFVQQHVNPNDTVFESSQIRQEVALQNLHEDTSGSTIGFSMQEENDQLRELDCFKELLEKESMSWWSSEVKEEAMFSCSADSLLLQECMRL